eukprot:CAMPEP_0174921658 /NCGR_PEP_ID=MMETSP1355-20121228/5305_1 /TAXON_ID=464990 /ORGANISM="Hemiselmis tepida, Strain CCMP443" /LENGTH=280 /DNA_ID=CAMNT_0016167171 /DNA_START=304 /DNA_END=1142 /DNA_ORIENTATION=-
MPRRLDLLAKSAQRHTLLPARVLDKYRKDPSTVGPRAGGLFGDDGWSHSLFTSRPIERLARVAWLRHVVLLLVLPAFCIHLSSSIRSGDVGSIPNFLHYRFTSLEQRDGGRPTGPGISEFGLMRLGEKAAGEADPQRKGLLAPCKARDASNATLRTDAESMVLSLASKGQQVYWMWYIVTADEPGTEDSDPVRFVMEGSDDEESWVTVGSSTVAHYYSKLFFTHGQGGTPLGRGSVLVLDAALPWQASFYYLWLGMPLFAMAAVALALASARYSVKWTVL